VFGFVAQGLQRAMTTTVECLRRERQAEPQSVIRFWIISLILAMIGLATLKVR
jgi:UDP-N-acetylmuramyl pentapeptide phosphotransferase/UDP-N-acetylglucosamine-1-phosphate transferase